jgi:hypothetical protein
VIGGGAFYDQAEVFQAHQQHRASDVHSPNWVMEEPALLRELGDVQIWL